MSKAPRSFANSAGQEFDPAPGVIWTVEQYYEQKALYEQRGAIFNPALERGSPAAEHVIAQAHNWAMERQMAPPPLDANDLAILQAFANASPAILIIVDVCGRTGLSNKTVGEKISRLLNAELLERPNGERKGATITPKGRLALKSAG